MKKILLSVSFFLALYKVSSQDFNDLPGEDDTYYYKLAIPELKEGKVKKERTKVDKPDEYVTAEERFVHPALPEMLEFAYAQLGTPYRGGGTGNGSFDCSGFTQSIYKIAGILLPHASWAQATYGAEIADSLLQVGDLLYFKGSNLNSNKVGHVGLVCEVSGGEVKMIHATVHGGVMIDKPFIAKYFKPRYLGARRILEEKIQVQKKPVNG